MQHGFWGVGAGLWGRSFKNALGWMLSGWQAWQQVQLAGR